MTGWGPDLGWDLAEVLDRLRTSELTVEGRLPWSSNLTFLVSLADTGAPRTPLAPGGSAGSGDAGGSGPPTTLGAVYKPARGEQTLWDFPDGLFRREAAAYVLSEALGWGLVPPTVVREDGPFGAGSLQLFVDVDYNRHYFSLFDEGGHEDALRTFCAFDVVANNADRKSGHVLLGRDGRLWGIDHGLCFHERHKLRTVVWDFAGEEVPGAILDDLRRLGESPPTGLEPLLAGAERDAMTVRIARLLDSGVFPEPTGDRPPYPWPLI